MDTIHMKTQLLTKMHAYVLDNVLAMNCLRREC